MIGSIAFRQGDRPGNDVRPQPAIRVGEENPVTCGGAGTDVTGMTFAQPAFRQMVNPLYLQARIFLCQSSENFARSVGGTIVHHDEFGVDSR